MGSLSIGSLVCCPIGITKAINILSVIEDRCYLCSFLGGRNSHVAGNLEAYCITIPNHSDGTDHNHNKTKKVFGGTPNTE